MRILRLAGHGLLVLALLATSVGWYRSERSLAARPGGNLRFTACSILGDDLSLSWDQDDSRVTPTIETRGRRVIVGLRTTAATDGDGPLLSFRGSMDVLVEHLASVKNAVVYADGTPLPCTYGVSD